MIRRIKTVADIAGHRLCLGCGACSYICPEHKVTLVDVLEEGVRPTVHSSACASCADCLQVCPAYENDHTENGHRPGAIRELTEFCGPVLELWEGHASDPEIRHSGSSGGLITALSLYCLQELKMHGVLHIGSDPRNPVYSKTRMSRTRTELLECTGSWYAPASACDSLHLIESSPAPCVFVGQPSEVTALSKAERLRPRLAQNVGLTLSFFCAGSPSTKGTLELLNAMGISPAGVKDIRYRGKGWPGNFAVGLGGQPTTNRQMSYKDSWKFLQAYRPFSTQLCPDGTGEDADISCGDPWYRQVAEGEAGSSLVLVRTERGRQILRGANESGYVALQQSNGENLINSQRNLLAKRGAIWGRIAALRAMGLPAPRLRGFSLLANWRRLPIKEKLRSTLGTARRVISRGYYRPLKIPAPTRAAAPRVREQPAPRTEGI